MICCVFQRRREKKHFTIILTCCMAKRLRNMLKIEKREFVHKRSVSDHFQRRIFRIKAQVWGEKKKKKRRREELKLLIDHSNTFVLNFRLLLFYNTILGKRKPSNSLFSVES